MRYFTRGVLALLAALLPTLAAAQARVTGADLEGTLRDDTGAVLAGANVTAVNVETGLERSTASDVRGRYVLAALPPGVYKVSAELFGFGSQTRERVTLLLGQAARVDFSLRLAGASETVTVTENAPVLDARRTAVAYVVGPQQIRNLPINGRNFISFSLITPGITSDRAAQGATATSGLSFTGQSPRSNNVMVDGFDNNDDTVGGVRGTFSQEAVREFQVLTDSYTAEFGNASGGVVNIVTHSGTNDLHGEAFAYFRDDALNAKDHFEKYDVYGEPVQRDKAPFRQWQWGGTLAGPLRSGRTFFFAAFEQTQTDANNFVNIDPQVASVLNAQGFQVELGDVPYQVRATHAIAKLNHQWTPRSTLVVRGSVSDVKDENAEAWGGIVAKSAGGVQLRKDWFASIAQTDVISERWLNEARVQVSRLDQVVRSLDPRCSGPCDQMDEGGPSVSLPGLAQAGRAYHTPQPRLLNRLQVSDTVSYFAGNHLLKAGFDYEHVDTTSGAYPGYFSGVYIFAPLPGFILGALGLPPRAEPITPVEALALGLPGGYVQGYGDPWTSYVLQEAAAFLQDEWRVTPRLTLKAGVRYQRQIWPKQNFDVSDVGGSRFQYPFAQDRDNFDPRVAVSFDPRGDGRTSLHGAWGRFHADHITGAAGVARIVNGLDGVRLYTRFFPDTLSGWYGADRRAPEPAGYPSAAITMDPALRTPVSDQIALGVDHTLGSDVVVSVNAISVRGKNQLGIIDYNPLVPALGPGRRPNDINGLPGSSAPLYQYSSYGESWYRGLAFSVSKRFSRNYEFLASYTLSKAEDTSTDFFLFPDEQGAGRNPADRYGFPVGFDPAGERGPSLNDQRHRFVLSGIAQLPLGLQTSAIVSAGSGRPFTPRAGADLNGNGESSADRARRNPSDPSSRVGRHSETTRAHVNVDVRLSRMFHAGGASLEVIAEAFNLFDRVNYVSINDVFGTGAFPDQPATDAAGRVTYGRYNKALAPRQVQLALKLGF
jgi:outer membrane receptor protein involved in Fe transport